MQWKYRIFGYCLMPNCDVKLVPAYNLMWLNFLQSCQKTQQPRNIHQEKLQQNHVQFSSLLGSCVYKQFQHCLFRFTMVHLVGSLYTSNKNRTTFPLSSDRQNSSAKSPQGHYSITCQKSHGLPHSSFLQNRSWNPWKVL